MKHQWRKKNLIRSLLSLAVTLTMLTSAFSQGTTDGTIAGVVQDSQGAVLAGAKVTAKNNATGQPFNTATSDNGTFRLNNVPVGVYTLAIEAQSFKAYSNPDVQVQLNRVTDVTATLEPGSVTETVTVTAGAAAELVEKTTSQLGKSFESRKVIELPIGANVNALALLSPNVNNQGSGVVGAGGSVGGQRARNNSFLLDGIDNNDPSVTGPQIGPIQDAVKEFTVLTNQFSAEFGHSSAAQFNTVTKTGTNETHGDLWYYNQNKFFNALDHRLKEQMAARAVPDKRPRFDFNRVGADVGGPVIKEKLFYFGAYEYQTQGTAGSSATVGAPTAEGFAILERLPGVSSFTLNILKQHVPPAGVRTGSVNVFGRQVPVGRLLVLVPSFFNAHSFHTNVDYNFSESDQLRGRFYYNRTRAPLPGTPGPEFTGSFVGEGRLFSLTEVHSFKPTLINEVRLGYRRQIANFDVPLTQPSFPADSFPTIQVDEIGLFVGSAGNLPQGRTTNFYQLVDTVSWVKGRHQMRFGGDGTVVISPSFFLPRSRGEYTYSTLEEYLADLKPTGQVGGKRGVGTGGFANNQWSFYSFFQDDFKWRPNLTVNLGLRYEYASLPRDLKLQSLNAVSDVPAGDPVLAQIQQRLPGLFPDGLTFGVPETDKNNFAPRVGFAWSPDFEGGWLHTLFGDAGQSSIRGGFGVAYDVLFNNLALLSLPPQFQQEVNTNGGSGGVFGSDRRFLETGGIPSGAVPREIFTDRALARALTGAYIVDQTAPYTLSWSLSYQRELMRNWSLELRYLGTRGVHLITQSQLNVGVPPGFNLPTFFSASEIPAASTLAGLRSRADFMAARQQLLGPLGFRSPVTTFSMQGNSIYHGGSASVKRRFANGLTLDAAYTLSKTIDDSTNELNSSAVNPRRAQNLLDMRDERAESVLSRRHRFVISWIYELPFYRNERGLIGQLLGNWQISGIYQAESGQLVTPLSFLDANGNLDAAGDRALINPKGSPKKGADVDWVLRNGSIVARGGAPASQVVAYVAKDPNAGFVTAEVGARANAGRNTLQAPGLNNWDLALFKRFPITERHRLEFRAEMFNAFNHPQFTVDNPFAIGFVSPRSPLFLDETQFSGAPRIVQLVLRYSF